MPEIKEIVDSSYKVPTKIVGGSSMDNVNRSSWPSTADDSEANKGSVTRTSATWGGAKGEGAE